MNTNYLQQPDIKTLEDLFGALFNGVSTSAAPTPPPPPAPKKEVNEYIFVYQSECGGVFTTENYYTFDEFSRVVDELCAVNSEPVQFSERVRDQLN